MALSKKRKRPALVIQTHPIIFESLIIPEGFLDKDKACQALWYYVYLTKEYIARIKEEDTNTYEGQLWPEDLAKDHRERFKSIALMYQTTPDKMEKFWSHVDMQCTAMGSPKIPEKYRFAKIADTRMN